MLKTKTKKIVLYSCADNTDRLASSLQYRKLETAMDVFVASHSDGITQFEKYFDTCGYSSEWDKVWGEPERPNLEFLTWQIEEGNISAIWSPSLDALFRTPRALAGWLKACKKYNVDISVEA